MKKSSLPSVITLLVALLLTVLYLQPTLDRDSQLSLEETETRQRLVQAQQALDSAKSTQTEIERLTTAEKERLRSQIPAKLDQQSIITELTDIAQKNNASLSSVTFSNLPEEAGLKRVAVVANFVGSGVANPAVPLLSSIENSNRLFIVKNLSLLFSASRSDFSLTLESYYKM